MFLRSASMIRICSKMSPRSHTASEMLPVRTFSSLVVSSPGLCKQNSIKWPISWLCCQCEPVAIIRTLKIFSSDLSRKINITFWVISVRENMEGESNRDMNNTVMTAESITVKLLLQCWEIPAQVFGSETTEPPFCCSLRCFDPNIWIDVQRLGGPLVNSNVGTVPVPQKSLVIFAGLSPWNCADDET